MATTVSVIDIFAGPGGLGEGFSAYQPTHDTQAFRIALSIEKDPHAHETLRLRSFYRQFPFGEAPDLYYDVLRQKVPLAELPVRLKEKSKDLFEHWQTADREAFCAELGASDEQNGIIHKRIREALGDISKPWVLIGGPPCQAYSVVGRARNKGIFNYRIEDDHRSSLYRQYLRIIADHWPTVFVMENVKGMLSAKVHDKSVFDAILSDLRSPKAAFDPNAKTTKSERYRIVPIVAPDKASTEDGFRPTDFVVACENYEIPQLRHRVILIGIREDMGDAGLSPLKTAEKRISVSEVIADLPPLRSGLSRRRILEKYVTLQDGPQHWLQAIHHQAFGDSSRSNSGKLKMLGNSSDPGVYSEVLKVLQNLAPPACDRGGEYIQWKNTPSKQNPHRLWYMDRRLEGVCNHETRSHMESDLARYLFAACFARVNGVSPKLSEFPACLQPDHGNAKSGDFDDRFRVQVAGFPSTTITSHISKDGHYFIHHDPAQCRSLTVREVARLQTFPDNYYFCGPRTAQCVQVGNAVPPFLAHQIAKRIWKFLVAAGEAS